MASVLPLIVFIFPWSEHFVFFFGFINSSAGNFFIEYPASAFYNLDKQIQVIIYV